MKKKVTQKAERSTGARGSRGGTLLFSGAHARHGAAAADMLAAQLEADVLRIDLSSVVSKYIGETEKNLDRLFARAERAGAVLLFDEAEALFGRRTDVKDSHDRYGAVGTKFLERLENYTGVAIVTASSERALDRSFVRRFAPVALPKAGRATSKSVTKKAAKKASSAAAKKRTRASASKKAPAKPRAASRSAR